MLSGGLDSAFMLYKFKNSINHVHVHHINIINKENRHIAESLACKQLLMAFSNYSYSESTHEMPLYDGNFQWDCDLVCYTAGVICLANPNIHAVMLGDNISDCIYSTAKERVDRSERIFNSFNLKCKIQYPLIDMTKEDIYNEAPLFIKQLSWSCRTPKYVDGLPVKCGTCKNCRS